MNGRARERVSALFDTNPTKGSAFARRRVRGSNPLGYLVFDKIILTLCHWLKAHLVRTGV